MHTFPALTAGDWWQGLFRMLPVGWTSQVFTTRSDKLYQVSRSWSSLFGAYNTKCLWWCTQGVLIRSLKGCSWLILWITEQYNLTHYFQICHYVPTVDSYSYSRNIDNFVSLIHIGLQHKRNYICTLCITEKSCMLLAVNAQISFMITFIILHDFITDV